jgi:hypothetical protein
MSEARNVTPALMEAIQAYGRAELAAEAAKQTAVELAKHGTWSNVAVARADEAREQAAKARTTMLIVAELEGFWA